MGVVNHQVNDVNENSFRLLAAQAIGMRLEAMQANLKGVRGGKAIEPIHHMRVASRRLRTALSLFESVLTDQQAKPWRKAIRRVTAKLGSARDLDVQIHFITTILEKTTEKRSRPGLKRLLLRLQQKRQHQQDHVNRTVDRLERSAALREMSLFVREMTVRGRLEQIDAGGPHAREVARSAIRRRLSELLTYDSFVKQEDRVAELHQMRIRAKRLRYTMEMFDALYDGKLDRFIKLVKKLQTLLGDIHDCDVWIDQLPRFLERERQRGVDYFGNGRGYRHLCAGIDELAANRNQQRQKLYAQFVEMWQSLGKENTWDDLFEVVGADAQMVARDDLQQLPPTQKTG